MIWNYSQCHVKRPDNIQDLRDSTLGKVWNSFSLYKEAQVLSVSSFFLSFLFSWFLECEHRLLTLYNDFLMKAGRAGCIGKLACRSSKCWNIEIAHPCDLIPWDTELTTKVLNLGVQIFTEKSQDSLTTHIPFCPQGEKYLHHNDMNRGDIQKK